MSRARRTLRGAAQLAVARMRDLHTSVATIQSGDPLSRRFASFGEGSRIEPPYSMLLNPGGISIGEGTVIRSHFMAEAHAPAGTVVIRIGDRSHFGHGVRLVAFNGITFEGMNGVGHGVTVADSIHDWKKADDDQAPWDTPPTLGRALRIGSGAWIGNNVVMTGGITIGRRSIITPNSVINRDVPDLTIVGGNPARVLRRRRADGDWEAVEGEPNLDEYLAQGAAVEDRR